MSAESLLSRVDSDSWLGGQRGMVLHAEPRHWTQTPQGSSSAQCTSHQLASLLQHPRFPRSCDLLLSSTCRERYKPDTVVLHTRDKEPRSLSEGDFWALQGARVPPCPSPFSRDSLLSFQESSTNGQPKSKLSGKKKSSR